MSAATTVVRSALNALSLVAPRTAGRLAFELWRRPVRTGAVRPAERAVHEEARRGTLTVGGREIVTYQWGDGARPVLLVHGWRSRASRFAGIVTRLVELGYTPVSYDAFGHGDSGSGPAGSILDHYEVIGRLAERHGPFEGVIGNSLGGLFALYALRHGLTAKWAVTVSGVGEFGYLVDAFCAGLGVNARVGRNLRRAIEGRLFDGDRTIWRRFSAGEPGGWDGGPLLVVHNDVDTVVVPAQADLIVAAYGDRVRRIVTSGLGHRGVLSDPQVISDIIAFITEANAGVDADSAEPAPVAVDVPAPVGGAQEVTDSGAMDNGESAVPSVR